MGHVMVGDVGDASKSKIAQLVELARRNDGAARDELLTKYRSYLRLLAWQRLPKFFNRRSDGSDVVQQTLVDAVRGLGEFRGQTEAEFTAWMLTLLDRNLLQVARRNMADKRDVRREVFEQHSDSSAQLMWHSLAAGGDSPHSVALTAEVSLHLAQALEQLPGEQRLAVELRYLGQQSLQEIADQMERSVSSVAGLIRRGVVALEPHLPPELGEWN